MQKKKYGNNFVKSIDNFKMDEIFNIKLYKYHIQTNRAQHGSYYKETNI